MGKMKDKELEEQEKVAESEVIEAPENITGEVSASNEQEEVVENEVIEAPENITGEDIVDIVSEEQVKTDKSKYRAKVSIIYNNKQYMPDDILDNVEADTIHSLLKNGFIELI